MKGRHSWATFEVLEKTFIIKMIPKSENCFYLEFLQVMMHQINMFFFFSIRVSFHGQWRLTGQQGRRRPYFIPLCHFQSLTNIQTSIWMLPSNACWLLKDLTSLLLTLELFEIFKFSNTYVNTTISNNSPHKI